MNNAQPTQIQVINETLNRELKDAGVVKALLATTFKKMDATTMKQAMMEGMIRGFTFKDFLEKNIYAIAYGDGYSLITSIEFARKRAMRNGYAGKSAPSFETETEEKEGVKRTIIISCTVTVKRRLESGEIGDFTATVYFDEYYKEGKSYGKEYKPSLWDTKPRTMIAKVAEMHALRMAFPEDLSQLYVEEEFDAERGRHPENRSINPEELKEGAPTMGKLAAKNDEIHYDKTDGQEGPKDEGLFGVAGNNSGK